MYPAKKFLPSNHRVQEAKPTLEDPKLSLGSKLLLSLTSLLLCAILFEAAVRLLISSPPLPKVIGGRPVRYYLPENASFERDYKYPEEKGPEHFRLAVVGDSFTFGEHLQFYDTFPKRLETMLNLNEHQPKVEVMTFGHPGRSTIHEAITIKGVAEHLHPDHLLLQITLNDPEVQPYSAQKGRTKGGRVILESPIFKHWKSLNLITSRLYNARARRETVKHYFDMYENLENWRGFTGSLETIRDTLAEHKIGFSAVVFPLFDDTIDGSYVYAPLHKRITDFMASIYVPTLDLTSAYAYIPAESLQVMPGEDRHPNELANRIAADSIYEFLEKSKALPTAVLVKNVVSHRQIRQIEAQDKKSPTPH